MLEVHHESLSHSLFTYHSNGVFAFLRPAISAMPKSTPNCRFRATFTALEPFCQPSCSDERHSTTPIAYAASKEAEHRPDFDVHSFQRPTILVAEDNNDLRYYLFRILSSSYDVELATNGSEALEKALKHKPDLVLSDLMMPGMGGRELLKRMRSDSRLRGVPVILLTSLTMSSWPACAAP